MRWQYCAQPPDRNLLFGFGPAQAIKKKLLTLWHSAKFLVDYGNVESFTPRYGDLAHGPEGALQPLDRWLASRTALLVTEATDGYERWLTVDVIRAFDAFVDDVSNWYIRRSRRRFWEGDEIALRALWHALVTGLRVISPVMPFLAEHLWRTLVAEVCEDAPTSVFLVGWPEACAVDRALLDEVAELRRVVALGHQARQSAEELAAKAEPTAAAEAARAEEAARSATEAAAATQQQLEASVAAQAEQTQLAAAQAADAQAEAAAAATHAAHEAHVAHAARQASARAKPRTYTVVKGDTLSEIGQKFGVSWRAIAELNHIENPDLIHPGDRVRVR